MENVKVIYFRSRYENLVNTLELCRHVVVSVVSTLNQIPPKVSSMIPFIDYSEVVYAERCSLSPSLYNFFSLTFNCSIFFYLILKLYTFLLFTFYL